MEAKVYSALERIQEDPPPNGRGVFRWMDRHRRDLIVVAEEKGVQLTIQLAGIKAYTFKSWMERRDVSLRPGSWGYRPPGSDLPAGQDKGYYMGLAEAYRDILMQMLRR